MSRLVGQIDELTRGYGRKGGKRNRAQQRARMAAFGVFCESLGVPTSGR